MGRGLANVSLVVASSVSLRGSPAISAQAVARSSAPLSRSARPNRSIQAPVCTPPILVMAVSRTSLYWSMPSLFSWSVSAMPA